MGKWVGAAIIAVLCGCGGAQPPAKPERTSTVDAAPPPLRHTLVVVPTGNGTVTSTPAGISCPGTCSAVFDDGSQVSLSAASEDDLSWGGDCAGAGACSVTLSRDAKVSARFDDPCASLMPATLPGPVEVQYPGFSTNDREDCAPPITDGAGTVWGKVAGFFAPLAVGETYYSQQMSASGWFRAWDGQTVVSETEDLLGVAGLMADGGVVFATADCRSWYGIDGPIQIRKLDPHGRVSSDVQLADESCPEAFFAVAVDALGRTVVLSPQHGEGRLSARWFDAKGQPLTAWFDLGPELSWWDWPGWGGMLYPLPGGGVALRAQPGGNENQTGGWLGTIPSGKAELQPPPKNFTGLTVRTLHGGKGFAFPGHDGVEIVSATGKVCGSVPIADADVGPEGSIVVGHLWPQDNTCTATVYPRALR